jgi:hypothetical protein
MPAGAGSGAFAVPAVAGGMPRLRWTLPDGWRELPASQMRVGNFAVGGEGGKEAQVSIIPLAGQGGGDTENVNRWRSQVGQPGVDTSVIDRLAEKVEIAGAEARLWDFAGEHPETTKPTRLLAAIQHRAGTAWFFKMLGDDALVKSQKERFVAFLKSVQFDTAAADTGPGGGAAVAGVGDGASPPSTPGAAQPTAPNAATGAGAGTAAGSGSGKPAWTVPTGWSEAAPGPMQLAKFTLGGDGAKAEATVVVLPGDAGGRLPNVNRWRGQLGLAAIGEAELEKALVPLAVPGAQTYLVDLVAEATSKRMLGAAVSVAGRTWFFKLVGDAATVGRERESFLKFVQSVDYGS